MNLKFSMTESQVLHEAARCNVAAQVRDFIGSRRIVSWGNTMEKSHAVIFDSNGKIERVHGPFGTIARA